MSTTSTTALTIVCPDWCAISALDHAEELWTMGGEVLHRSLTMLVADPSQGPDVGIWGQPRPGEPVAVSLATATNPAGQETASPTFHVSADAYSLEQLEGLIVVLTDLLATYRSTPRRP